MKTNDITYAIIGAAFKVHRELGPGLLESIYEEAMTFQLREDGLQVRNQITLPVYYHGAKLSCEYRLDLLVNEEVIVELKSTVAITDIHKKQLLTYLRIAHKPVGLILNFNQSDMKNGISRIVNDFNER